MLNMDIRVNRFCNLQYKSLSHISYGLKIYTRVVGRGGNNIGIEIQRRCALKSSTQSWKAKKSTHSTTSTREFVTFTYCVRVQLATT